MTCQQVLANAETVGRGIVDAALPLDEPPEPPDDTSTRTALAAEHDDLMSAINEKGYKAFMSIPANRRRLDAVQRQIHAIRTNSPI